MYSDNQSVQILISLLKEFDIKLAILSPGSRNIPFVHSIEKDPHFDCYSIVDERSAAYFAIGLALEMRQPVIISCTSGTAATNYTSALCEAYDQCLPIVAVTADRNQYYLNQLEDQMIPQPDLYKGSVKKSVTLPIIKDDKDHWYCRRLVNEALLELSHRGGGPVHINIPIEWGLFAQNFNTKKLPVFKPITRVTRRGMYSGDIDIINELKSKKRILVIYGQSLPVDKEIIKNIEGFASKYPCAIAVETISNLYCEGTINTSLISRTLTKDEFTDKFAPDLVISLNGNYVSTIKGLLKGCSKEFEHWTVNEEGKVVDQFKKLTKIFEGSTEEFFSYFDENGGEPVNHNSYLELWRTGIKRFAKPDFPYSSGYAMQEFTKQIPKDSILHYGNGVAVHVAQYFPLDKSIVTYCHSGTTTIDGSLSAFIGQASASKRLCFMFIGDLSFFYDMNALWNRYVGKNVRILLYNNEGGQTFYWNSLKDIDSLALHTAAEHFSTAKGWVESRGFMYLSARNRDEFDASLPKFVSAGLDAPVLFEVFTKKETDARILLDYYENCRKQLRKTL
jgi:2-succinyl-5-enolpyruvyl-6-hydroxy-3-cyclohexene-1-carboxylate synthase